jgi:hypothetical protein
VGTHEAATFIPRPSNNSTIFDNPASDCAYLTALRVVARPHLQDGHRRHAVFQDVSRIVRLVPAPHRSFAASYAPAMENEFAQHVEEIHTDGITALRGAFSRDWVDRMREDMMTAFWDAIQRPGGAVGRGPRRWYVEVHPQQISGFVDLVTHPWVTGICHAVLGPSYEIVEVGFDVPFQGAKHQPWHRDFPSPAETYAAKRITSLAFNLTGVDVTPDMGPFEIALGTQYDDGRAWPHEMFPPEDLWPRFAERGVKKYPKMGDISARSALTVHRGTTHPSPITRPVLVLGVDAPGAGHAALHDMLVTQDYYDALPEGARKHLVCRVVDEIVPITQKHQIEGLVMGVEP